MHVIVAGGSSPTLGRAIVTACLSAGHQVTILARMPEDLTKAAKAAHGGTIKYVTYEDVDSLQSAIRSANVVISVLKIINDELNLTTHLNLLHATLATATATRFVPSDWSMYRLATEQVDLLSHKNTLLHACQEIVATSDRPDFEIAQFKNGGFLNYFAQGAPSVAEHPEVLGGLEDDLMLEYIDVASGTLPIPVNDKDEPSTVSMTHIDDIGRYVAAAMALPAGAWPRSGIINIAGNTFTYQEVRDILETQCGLAIKHTVVTPADCDRRKAEADAKLAQDGFDLQVFKAGMVAQMQKVICGGLEGGSWERNDLTETCAAVTPVDLKKYLVDPPQPTPLAIHNVDARHDLLVSTKTPFKKSAPKINGDTNSSRPQNDANPVRNGGTSCGTSYNTAPTNNTIINSTARPPPSSSSSPSTPSTRSFPPSTPLQNLSVGYSAFNPGITDPARYPSTVPLASQNPLLASARPRSDAHVERELLMRWETWYGPGQRLGVPEEMTGTGATGQRGRMREMAEGNALVGTGPAPVGPAGGGVGATADFETAPTRGLNAVPEGRAAVATTRVSIANDARAASTPDAAELQRSVDGENENEDGNEGEEFSDPPWGEGLRQAEERGYQRSLGPLKRKREEEDEEGLGGVEGGAGAVGSEQDGDLSESMGLVDSYESGDGLDGAEKGKGQQGAGAKRENEERELKKPKLG